MNRPLLLIASLVALLLCIGCVESPTSVQVGLGQPLGFAYACEGDEHTVAPALDERPDTQADFELAPLCPQVSVGGNNIRGLLLGVVLNQHPPSVSVIQLDPSAGAGAEVLDTDLFIPGITAVPVGTGPTHIVRAPDWSAFYVLSAGSRELTRLEIGPVQAPGRVGVSTTVFPLPGVPGELLATDGGILLSAAERPELWVLPTDPAPGEDLTVLPLGDTIQEMGLIEGDLLITWRNRPVLSRWPDALDDLQAANPPTFEEVGLIGPCEDTLDNDGDTLIDAQDAGCHGPHGREDAPGPAPTSSRLEPTAEDHEASCLDGLDNDGDGLADALDTTCAGEEPTELLGPCEDGLDNDLDGLVDAGLDPDCYGPAYPRETSASPWSPARLAVVGRSQSGHAFAYVHLEGRQELAVVSLPTDAPLQRVDVSAHGVQVPSLKYVPYQEMPSGDTDDLPGYRVAQRPGPAQAGNLNLKTSSLVGGGLQAGRLRGELWERIVEPEEAGEAPSVPLSLSSSVQKLPAGCDSAETAACEQPAGDSDSWYVYLPRLDGHVDLVEAIRRGAPVHRLAQSTVDPAERPVGLSARPRLFVDGKSVLVGSNPPYGAPLLGPMIPLEEVEPAVPDESAARQRSYGIWSPGDPEAVATETFGLTYEGILPGTSGTLGGPVDTERFQAPGARFCEAGIRGQGDGTGDWLVLRASRVAVSDELIPSPWQITTLDGADRPCPLEESEEALISFRILEATQVDLVVVPGSARLRRPTPTLDQGGVEAGGATVAACQEALGEALLLSATSGGEFSWTEMAPEGLTLLDLPARVSFAVRPDDAWTVVGSESGFLHDNIWLGPSEGVDGAEGSPGICTTDLQLSKLSVGRARPSIIAGTYETCPPSNAELAHDEIEGLVAEGSQRFVSHSFEADLLPGCRTGEDGEVVLIESRRDTRWSISLDGPDSTRSIFISNPLGPPALAVLDVRRQLVHMDTNLGRLVVLQLQPEVVTPVLTLF